MPEDAEVLRPRLTVVFGIHDSAEDDERFKEDEDLIADAQRVHAGRVEPPELVGDPVALRSPWIDPVD